ncbi:hypothetical protein [Cellulomonas sp. B6]|uniref:hypothetical protein n=1 Tax=Cellulomonas sp. B6 TaxID=1295626 RepID=UPI00073CA006|nr:hypothetical protein [Cellulomonas sp. B6]KSW23558.1 hypothetical protein ATM99_12845 [Cellulomonas sp. B6]
MTTTVPSPATTSARSWWRRNRWALVALPLALALMAAASADRVRSLWWEQGLHSPTTAGQGQAVTFHQDVRDGLGGTRPVDVEVRLDAVVDAGALPDGLVVPAGARAVQVEMTLSADPDVVLRGCSLAVRDADGTRYDYVADAWGATQAVSPCVPADAPGPAPSLGDLDDVLTPDSTPERPATWTVSPVVVLPADVQVSDVVLWWQLPQHVVLPTARG